MAQLIFEVGCEDLPARFVAPALAQMQAAFTQACLARRISVEGEVRVVGTPRRLALLVDGLATQQQDLQEERLGPPAKAALREGEYTQAAHGFARGLGLTAEQLYLVDTPRGPYVAARVFEAGAPTATLLPELLLHVAQSFSFPKSMRWGARRDTFARPVRWLLATLDGVCVPLSFAGVVSGDVTFGHRFSAPDPITVTSIAHYVEALRAADVEVDPAERRAQIKLLLTRAADEAGGQLIEDEALLDEVVQLVEKPHVVCVRFDERYLEMPDEVLILSMRSHQRYFAIKRADGAGLLNACAVIYNTPVRDPDVVRAGNLRVLKARLDDARFFWAQDLKTPLEQFLPKLERVVWLGALGSLSDRAHRISALVSRLGMTLGLPEQTRYHAQRAGLLAKADLATSMVYEFTDLQGIMGRAYASHAGEPEAIALAIEEHYLPKGADDALPSTDEGALVALAERLDALVGIFGVGLVPRSNADPYALRRAALGVLRITQSRAYPVLLSTLLAQAWEVYHATGLAEAAFTTSREALLAQLEEFITTRHKHLLATEFPADVVDAVLAVASDELLAARDRVAALAQLRQDDDFEPLAIGFKRVVNLLRKQADAQLAIPEAVDPELLVEPQERALHQHFGRARGEILAALEGRDWAGACQSLITLKAPVDAFFDHVMVMTDVEALRANRLALLDRLRVLFLQVADISMIQTER